MKRYKKVEFNSPSLVQYLIDQGYKARRRWFEMIDYGVRCAFAEKYCTKTWNVAPNGNPTSIVASYPSTSGKVLMFDLDSGESFLVPLSKLTKSRISGECTLKNYEFNMVIDLDTYCEIEDFTSLVEWPEDTEFLDAL